MATTACLNSIFMHIPKCAGSAMSSALRRSGVGLVNYREVVTFHANIEQLLPEHIHLQKLMI